MDLSKIIDRIADIINSSDIKEIKVKDSTSSIFMTKNNNTSVLSRSTPVESLINTEVSKLDTNYNNEIKSIPKSINVNNIKQIKDEEIKSPMVGTFYGRSSPNAIPYVKEGQTVKKGDILCIIEAMKIMNKIEAERAGKITKILSKDGDPVQFDQPLFVIE